MAKTKAVEWGPFHQGKVVDKEQPKKSIIGTGTKIAAVAIVALALSQIGVPPLLGYGAAKVGIAMVGEAVPVMAAAAPNFTAGLHKALEPIRTLIMGFGHEIYGVFMIWGAIEVMIGKTQAGFNRMKLATLGYVLLVWAPKIVDWISSAVG